MHKNYFDIIMEHIEENVTIPTEDIKREIPRLIGRHRRAFGEHFNLLTGYTLDYYIKQRRLNHAARALIRCCKEKTICDIALEYQFSDQSAFSRAIKAKYGVTPGEIRAEGLWVFEEQFHFTDFTGREEPDTEVAKLLRSMEIGGPFHVNEYDLMLGIEEMCNDFGFDIDIGYQIADLAERLGLPFGFFAQSCVNAMAEVQNDPEYRPYNIPPEVEFMLQSNLDYEEMDAMCEHYGCEYYELDELKIYKYRKMKDQK